jgi:hypothetical protein
MRLPDTAPPRLVDVEGPAGDCLREELEAPQMAPIPRFVELRDKRARRVRGQRAVLLGVLGAAALFIVPRLENAEPAVSITAEHAQLVRRPSSPVEAAPPTRSSSPPPPAALPSPAVATAAVKPPRPRARPQAEPPEAPRRAAAAVTAAAAPEKATVRAKDCAELARAGDANGALLCYEGLAAGEGTGAELALFEQARLQGKVLRRPAQALATLDSYRRRFPNGSLRAEVMLAQIEWRVASGDAAGARELVDEALASGLLRERTAELERLRSALVPALP